MYRSLKCALACAVVLMVTTASAEAAPTWLPAETLSPNGSDVDYYPDIASDAAGDVIAVWDRYDGSKNVVEAAVRPAGGSFSVVPISGDGSATEPRIAMNASGDAVAVWSEYDGADNYIWAASRPAGGSFGAPVKLSGAGGTTARIAIAADGRAVAVWDRFTVRDVIEGAIRPAGGNFGSAVPLSSDVDYASAPTVAMNGAGVSAVAWRYNDSSNTGRYLIQGYVIPAGGSFPDTPAPDTISDTTHDGDQPAVGIDAIGNTTALWDDYDGVGHTVVAKVRPTGGSWPSDSDPVATDANGGETMAVNPDGAAVAAWVIDDGLGHYLVKAAVRAAGGAFGGAVTLSPASAQSELPHVAINERGDVAAIWRQYQPAIVTAASIRPAGGTFGDAKQLTADNPLNNNYQAITLDPLGNAAAVWVEQQDDDFDSYRARVAAYDASPPALSNVSIPDSGTAGNALLFSASASDIWSPVSIGWGFSDGGAGAGSPLSHVFAAPGTYAATVTATDGVGNSASQTKQLAISAAPQTTQNPNPNPTPSVADRTAPGISGLSVKPSKFRKRTKIGYSLTEVAKVRFTVERALPGRKVGFRCVAPTNKNRGRKRCTRFKALKGSLSQDGKAGSNSLTFNGRIGNRKLPPGSYRLVVRATDAAGNASATKRVNFKIIR